MPPSPVPLCLTNNGRIGSGPLGEVSGRSPAGETDASILALFPHELNNVKQLRKVRPEDFDVQALLTATQEGRLYIEEVKEDYKENIEEEVRAYVDQIRMFATSEFSPYIDDIWGQILACEEFIDFLAPGPKARKFRKFNKYNVMRIIGVLREAGVYEQYNWCMYDTILEQTEKDSRYRKYLGKGIEQRALLKLLTRMLKVYS